MIQPLLSAAVISVALLFTVEPSPAAHSGSGGDGQASSHSEEQQAAEHNTRGVELAHRGEHAAAVQEFRQTVAIQPGFAEAYYNMGLSLLQMGDSEEALKSFQTASRLRPESALIHLGVAS